MQAAINLEGTMLFLDDVSLETVQETLQTKIIFSNCHGDDFIRKCIEKA